MICDKIKNANLYLGISPRIDRALSVLQNIAADAPIGSTEVEGRDLFYSVQRFTATPGTDDKKFEAHRRYIDIQAVLSGTETIYFRQLAKLCESIPYSDEKDIGFYVGQGFGVTLSAGDFMLLFPDDAHMPAVGNGEVVKAVIKIKI